MSTYAKWLEKWPFCAGLMIGRRDGGPSGTGARPGPLRRRRAELRTTLEYRDMGSICDYAVF